MTKEALTLALEAMKSFQNGTNGLYEGEFEEEIRACEEALQSNEQVEPVALSEEKKLILIDSSFDDLMYWLERCERNGHLENCPDLIEPWEKFDYSLYTHPPVPTAQPEQELVCVCGAVWEGQELVHAPPQRPSRSDIKPLTRGQIREIEVDVSLNPSFDYITPAEQLCRAIEAAHGIKE